MRTNLVDEDFIRNEFKDPELAKIFITNGKRRTIITSILIGCFIIISLIAMAFGFQQNIIAQKYQQETDAVKNQIEACSKESIALVRHILKVQQKAEESNKKAMDQLTECKKRR